MASTQPSTQQQCAKYKYVLTSNGPKIVPVNAPDVESKDEESAADYNQGGYLAVKLRDTFKNGRYVVQRKLGYVSLLHFSQPFPRSDSPSFSFFFLQSSWGHFSTVWLIKDNEYATPSSILPPRVYTDNGGRVNRANKHSALKVVKSAGRYAETARDEIKLLRKVMSANPQHPGRDFVVSFLDSFTYQGPEESHVCIVFEPLGENLLALIERNKAKGVPRSLVKTISRQILLGLQYLHDECDLVHTDIKPENISKGLPSQNNVFI